MRIDQWLWAVRVFKSRSLATDAIRAGYVLANGRAVKPAHEVRAGEVIVATQGAFTRTVRVLAAPESRVGAKLVADFAEDLTPPEEWERRRAEPVLPPVFPSLKRKG